MSDDGTHGLTLIAFIGSAFSPYYAWARERGSADPLDHCAFNVALYGPRAGRWAMTERGANQVTRSASDLSIGTSSMRWTGDALEMQIHERCAPIPQRVRGTVRVIPTGLFDHSFALDEAGRHRWTPFAPTARIEVSFSEPKLSWCGTGYLDSNRGSEPLEHAFTHWTWSRAATPGSSVVLYDVHTRDAQARSLALRFDANACVDIVEPPPRVELPLTSWRVARHTRADAGTPTHIVKTLEDAPFYSRAVLDTSFHGTRGPCIHESLDLVRFRAPWVRCLLPFRMPRITF